MAIYPDQCTIYGAQNKIQCISGVIGHVKTLQHSLVPVISHCENRQLEHKKLFSDRLTVHAVAIYPDQCSIYGAENKIHNISGVIGRVKTLQHSLVPVISHCENRQLEHKKLFSDRLTVHAVAIYPDQCSIYGAKNKIHYISGVIGHVKTSQHSFVLVRPHSQNRWLCQKVTTSGPPSLGPSLTR